MSALKLLIHRAFEAAGFEIRRKRPWTIPEMTAEDDALLRAVEPFSMTPRPRLWNTLIAVRHAVRNQVPGDFVECGVWRGGQAMLAAYAFKREQDLRQLWLFDTFAGMTEPTLLDRRPGEMAFDQFRKAQRPEFNAWCYASFEDVKANMESTAYDAAQIRYVKGPVEETLLQPANLPDRIAILRLDTDWYESTKLELEVLFPLLSRHGVLVIDDYGYWDGTRTAVDEYFAKQNCYPFLQPIDEEGRLFLKY